jgi:hypothetical protein
MISGIIALGIVGLAAIAIAVMLAILHQRVSLRYNVLQKLHKEMEAEYKRYRDDEWKRDQGRRERNKNIEAENEKLSGEARQAQFLLTKLRNMVESLHVNTEMACSNPDFSDFETDQPRKMTVCDVEKEDAYQANRQAREAFGKAGMTLQKEREDEVARKNFKTAKAQAELRRKGVIQ